MRLEIFYIIVLICLLIVHKSASESYNPESDYFNKGYGNNNEDIETLLNRTDWANRYKGRIGFFTRNLFYSMVIILLVFIVSLNRVPRPIEYVSGVFMCWLLLSAFYKYTQHHCEKFGHYAVDKNINILRKKLKAKKGAVQKTDYKFVGASDCWNFVY